MGLEERWPVHVPHRGWMIMDREAVIDEIISRAGGADLRKLDIELTPIRDDFENLRENAISILTAILATQPDAFLQKRVQEVEKLTPRDPHAIAMDFLPRGQVMTRGYPCPDTKVSGSTTSNCRCSSPFSDGVEGGN
jgi:hypothetical protein